MLTDPLPPELPYVVMFDEDCAGDTEFCRRIIPVLVGLSRSLASIGDSGRFIRAKGAGHDIFLTEPALVRRTVDELLEGS